LKTIEPEGIMAGQKVLWQARRYYGKPEGIMASQVTKKFDYYKSSLRKQTWNR
jgi:hypothetical protein